MLSQLTSDDGGHSQHPATSACDNRVIRLRKAATQVTLCFQQRAMKHSNSDGEGPIAAAGR